MIEPDSDQWATNEFRVALMAWALARDGGAYRWCGKGEFVADHEWTDRGLPLPSCKQVFDCSGFVTRGLVSVRMVPESWALTHNADRLFHELEPVGFGAVEPMDLAFWGPHGLDVAPSRATHVMFLWHDGRVFGACGGNESTLTLETAHRVGARVRFRSSHLYRTDFLGFRRLPLKEP